MTETAHPQRWKAMPFIALAVSLIIMDATVVNVALPVIIGDLKLSASDAEWINSIYSLVFAALLITLGRVGDLHGRKKLLVVGIIAFGIASVLASFSTSGVTLIFARFLQGVGGAMVLPATLSTVNALFKGKERGIAFAIWGSTIGGMAAVGPVVGGWLTTVSSWHWAFLINIPIVIIVLIGASLFIPETKDPHVDKAADFAGIFLSIVGLSLIVFGLIEGIRFGWITTLEKFSAGPFIWSWSVSPVAIAFVVGFATMAIFVRTEKARAVAGKPILLDLDLLKIKSFRYGSIAALVVALGEFGMLFSLPLFLQGGLGYSALRTGVLILALAMGTFLISGGTPQLSARMGGRAVVRLGLALEAIAILGMSFSFSLTVPSIVIAAWLFLYGAGVGLATAQLTSVILAEVPVEQSGQASGLQSTFRQLGSSLGVAILGALFFTVLGSTRIQGADVSGLLDAAKTTTLVAAVVIGFGLMATIALPESKPVVNRS